MAGYEAPTSSGVWAPADSGIRRRPLPIPRRANSSSGSVTIVSQVGSRNLVRCPVSHDAPQCGDGVPHADLLAFRIGSAVVVDRHFTDPPSGGLFAGDLGRDLRLEAESVAPQRHAGQHLPTEHFVARLHI